MISIHSAADFLNYSEATICAVLFVRVRLINLVY